MSKLGDETANLALDRVRELEKELAEVRDSLQRAEERSSLNFREYERASKELDLEQSAHAETRAKLEEHEKRAALYDQECNMCGADADDLIAFADWTDERAELDRQLADARASLDAVESDRAAELDARGKYGFKTPAEQAVLDAMAARTDEQLRLMASGAWCGHGQDAAIAELARREAANDGR